MITKKIVITGGPGTGKSSIINELTKRGYTCYEEISRQVILNARKDIISIKFLADCLIFNQTIII